MAIRVSFDFFPPKTEEMEKNLWEAIERLSPLSPNFVSVTYGAGGSTRERTHATVTRILSQTALTPAAHLTCVAASRAEVDADVAIRPAASVRNTRRIRVVTGTPPILSPASSVSAILKSRCRPTRKSIRTARPSRPTSTC